MVWFFNDYQDAFLNRQVALALEDKFLEELNSLGETRDESSMIGTLVLKDEMIKAIAFDFVGVIGTERKLQLTPFQEHIEAQFGLINHNARFIQHFVDETGLNAEVIEAETRWIIEHLYVLREPDLFEHLPPLRFCLASNHLSYLLDWFTSLPIAINFEFMLNPTQLGTEKPHLAFFQNIIKRFDLPPYEILFVDDTQDNINGAKLTGLQCLHYKGEQTLSSAVNTWLANQQE